MYTTVNESYARACIKMYSACRYRGLKHIRFISMDDEFNVCFTNLFRFAEPDNHILLVQCIASCRL
jgi:hypothetical protein